MRKRTSTSHFPVVGIRGALFALAAASCLSTVAPAAPQTPDYSRGFQSFYALGLTDVKEAGYVRLDASAIGGMDPFSRSGNRIPATGNAWLIERIDDDEAVFLLCDCRRITVISKAKQQKEIQEKMAALAAGSKTEDTADGDIDAYSMNGDSIGDGRRNTGSWKPANLTEDAQKWVTFLEALPDDDEDQRRETLQALCGPLFLMAAHMHRQGATAEANRLASLLFIKTGDSTKVIESSISILADTQYADLYRDFKKDRDWTTLGGKVNALLARFSRGWSRRDAVARAASLIAPRLAGPPAPLAAPELSVEDQALAAELGTTTNAVALRQYGQSVWLLPEETQEDPAASDAMPSVLSRIKARRTDAIPLLIALLGDTYPTVVDNPSGSPDNFMYSYSYYSSYGMESPQAAERVAAQMTDHYFAGLPRPLTRGEIAETLLLQVIPVPQDMFYDQSSSQDNARTEAIRLAASDWYAANKGKPARELAIGYLEQDPERGGTQQQEALLYLAGAGSTQELAMVESKLLTLAPAQGYGLAMQYATVRGDDARPFIERYIAILTTPVEPAQSDGGDALFVQSRGRSDNKKWMERIILQFKGLLSNEGLEELLTGVVSGTHKIGTINSSLGRAIAREKPERAISLLLEAAINTKDAATAVTFLQTIQMIPYSHQSGRRGRAPKAGEEPFVMPKPADHADRWLALLDDERTVPEAYGSGGDSTIGLTAAYMIASMASENPEMGMYDEDLYAAQALFGTRLTPLIKQRARLLLEGKIPEELPPLPSAENISAEARVPLLAGLMAGEDPAALRERVNALSMDEELAVLEEAEENTALNAKLAPLANIITDVNCQTDNAGIKAALEGLKNTALTRKTAEQLFEAVRELAPGGKPAMQGMIARTPGMGGVKITLRESTAQESRMLEMSSGYRSQNSVPMIIGMLRAEDDYESGRWPAAEDKTLEKPNPEEKTEPVVSEAETRRQQFIKTMLAASGQALPPEALAALESMSEEDFADMGKEEQFSDEQNEEFWKSVEKCCQPGDAIGHHLNIMFYAVGPQAASAEDDGEGEEDMDIYSPDPFGDVIL